ncbi:MAG: hypothetical protein OXF44_02870 [Anaerolineaceae bacterium]|nr:hypothetical protein [Anaerolineaceae bacterium]
MLRILVFVVIAVTLLSPVSAQQLTEPTVFNLEAFAAQGLAGTRQNDPSCVIGNGGNFVSPGPATTGFPAVSLPFNSGNAWAFPAAELPTLTLPDYGASGYRLPRSLTWLPDSEFLFGVPEHAAGLVFDVPLLFPGLGRTDNLSHSTYSTSDDRMSPAFHDDRHQSAYRADARAERATTAALPSSVLPAGMHDALAGLHRLWNCVGTDPTQLAFAAAGAGAPAASAALPAAPHWEVNELANNLGGLGRIYRADYANAPALVVNRLVSATQEELAFRVNQAEFNSAGVGCFKASSDRRIAATKQANGNAVIAMGPDHENKTFHVIFNGGLNGQVGGTVTTYDGPPGAACG